MCEGSTLLDTASLDSTATAVLNGNYPGTVTFSAAGLPSGASISFSPDAAAANGGTALIRVSLQPAPQKTALNGERLGSLALAVLMFPVAASKRIRRSSRRLLAVVILLLGGLVAATSLSGCGYNGNGFFGQGPNTYTITITATSGTIQHAVHVTLQVQ